LLKQTFMIVMSRFYSYCLIDYIILNKNYSILSYKNLFNIFQLNLVNEKHFNAQQYPNSDEH